MEERRVSKMPRDRVDDSGPPLPLQTKSLPLPTHSLPSRSSNSSSYLFSDNIPPTNLSIPDSVPTIPFPRSTSLSSACVTMRLFHASNISPDNHNYSSLSSSPLPSTSFSSTSSHEEAISSFSGQDNLSPFVSVSPSSLLSSPPTLILSSPSFLSVATLKDSEGAKRQSDRKRTGSDYAVLSKEGKRRAIKRERRSEKDDINYEEEDEDVRKKLETLHLLSDPIQSGQETKDVRRETSVVERWRRRNESDDCDANEEEKGKSAQSGSHFDLTLKGNSQSAFRQVQGEGRDIDPREEREKRIQFERSDLDAKEECSYSSVKEISFQSNRGGELCACGRGRGDARKRTSERVCGEIDNSSNQKKAKGNAGGSEAEVCRGAFSDISSFNIRDFFDMSSSAVCVYSRRGHGCHCLSHGRVLNLKE